MHDAKELLSADAAALLTRRGYRLDSQELATRLRRRGELIRRRDTLRAALNGAGGQQADGIANGADARRARKKLLQTVEEEHRTQESDLRDLLLAIPNLPADDAPEGGPEDPPVHRRAWGEQRRFGFAPRSHVDLGAKLGVLDPARAAKLSGSRFAVTAGAGARLERALAWFFLDQHTRHHGYVEYGLPHMVSPASMTGTGQLPKFAEDLFHTEVSGRELLLIPTGEVPLVNLYRDEVIDEKHLPLALTACTPCYRAEAGSYGRDTQGLIRLHQFEKVELVRICHPDRAAAELELLTQHAEQCLRDLELHYRVVELRAGDLGFAARRTYDLEVWLPSQDTYREVSSCSDCGTFQARRSRIRLRLRGGGKTFPATLNGSGLPIGRTMAAILEQHQQADGSVTIPRALVPYTGFARIDSNGEPTS